MTFWLTAFFIFPSESIEPPHFLRLGQSGGHQPPSNHEQVGQRAGHRQALGVLLQFQSSITQLCEPEHALDHRETVLYLGPHPRLGAVSRLLCLIHHAAMPVAPVGEVLGARRMFANDIALAAISLVAPDAGFLSMQQIAHNCAVMHVRRRRHHRVNDLGFAVHAHMRLHAEIPLLPFAGLVHLRIAPARRILSRRRCRDNRRVHDRARGYLDPARFKVRVNLLKQHPPEIVRLKQVAEFEAPTKKMTPKSTKKQLDDVIGRMIQSNLSVMQFVPSY